MGYEKRRPRQPDEARARMNAQLPWRSGLSGGAEGGDAPRPRRTSDIMGKCESPWGSGQRHRRIEDVPSKEPGFVERLQTAAKAKKAQAEKIRAAVPAKSVQSAERQAGQLEAAAARKARAAERKASERLAAQEKEALRAAEKARQAQAVIEEAARKRLEQAAQADADAALKRDQKAARDAKYAARKARQR